MSTFIPPPLDFDVVREIWNKYELADNSFLKVKVILTGIKKGQAGQQTQTTSPTQYSFDFQQIVLVHTNEHGTPDPKVYSPQELQSFIIKDDIRFTTITQDWNEYLVDDGTRIKIQPMVVKVAKTSKFNNKGEPVYTVDLNVNVQVKPHRA